MDSLRFFHPERRSPAALAALRVGLGVIFMAHGWMKLQDPASFTETLTGLGLPMPELFTYLAIAGELGGGALLALGLLTPLGALGAAVTMAVAIATVHAGNGLFAKNNGWEFPGILMVAALFFFFRGAGRYSVDALIARRYEDAERSTKRRAAPSYV
jgi:putative oxidoreductase